MIIHYKKGNFKDKRVLSPMKWEILIRKLSGHFLKTKVAVAGKVGVMGPPVSMPLQTLKFLCIH